MSPGRLWCAQALSRTVAREAVQRIPRSVRHFSSSTPRLRQRLVILGSGWGGYELLKGVDKKRWSQSWAEFFLLT